LLIEEIELLHIDLWNAKSAREEGEVEPAKAEGQTHESIDRTLRARLSRIRSR